jgi:hypothetical protein
MPDLVRLDFHLEPYRFQASTEAFLFGASIPFGRTVFPVELTTLLAFSGTEPPECL